MENLINTQELLLVGDHFLKLCDLTVWFRGDIVRKISFSSLLGAKGQRVKRSICFRLEQEGGPWRHSPPHPHINKWSLCFDFSYVYVFISFSCLNPVSWCQKHIICLSFMEHIYCNYTVMSNTDNRCSISSWSHSKVNELLHAVLVSLL